MQRPAVEPHLLPGQVLRLPAQGRCSALRNLGLDRGHPLRAVVPLGAGAPAEGPDDARGLRRRQLRLAPLRPLLQGLQHEGVGRPAVGDLRRVGRPAHQGHDAVDARCGSRSGPGSPGRRGKGQAGHQPHRGVPVPEVRPRDDVGALPRARRGPGLQGRVRGAGHARSRHAGGRATAVVGRRRPPYDADHVISSMPFNGAAQGHGPAGARRGAARPPTTWRSATSCRSPSSSPPTRWPGPTTGSTSTIPRSRPCGCRTSARGRRTW